MRNEYGSTCEANASTSWWLVHPSDVMNVSSVCPSASSRAHEARINARNSSSAPGRKPWSTTECTEHVPVQGAEDAALAMLDRHPQMVQEHHRVSLASDAHRMRRAACDAEHLTVEFGDEADVVAHQPAKSEEILATVVDNG